MDAIRLKQIEEVMGYDNHINTMVFDMEKKRVSQTIRERPEDEYALIDAQKMADVNDAANALQLMLDGKLGNVSLMTHHGIDVNNTHSTTRRKTCGRRKRRCPSTTRSLHSSCLPTARPRCNNTS